MISIFGGLRGTSYLWLILKAVLRVDLPRQAALSANRFGEQPTARVNDVLNALGD
jgi:hypothetical protein